MSISSDTVVRSAANILNSRFDKSSDFRELSILIASKEDILNWSYGEVKRSDTINYRTFKPERDGLFCAKIFGPTKDYECQCGKYRRVKYKGIKCEKCEVEVITSRVRRERMGHIDLVTPVVHIWFLKINQSKIAVLLDKTVKDLERVLYFESYIVTDSGNSTLEKGTLLDEDQYESALDEFGFMSFKAEMGAQAIKSLLSSIDLQAEEEKLHGMLLATRSETKKKSILKRLKLVTDFISSNNKPEWMVLDRLPVLPPDLRPLVMLDGGRFASSDLNELYRRVINRNNRLKKLKEVNAPEIILRNEMRMLQEAVDTLFDNSRKIRVSKNALGRPFKSLSDSLKGKQGRFRQNLLGKRVDYSGRSVIVAGPELRLHQCGLPKKMALELFKPFVFARLQMYGKVNSIKNAKKLVDNEVPEVWKILEDVIKEHPVLLNRAPTLHRLGMQAFEPKLIESKAIQLHPLVCKAFNADFDGDQMAVHVPLSLEAQVEARVLLMSSNNILNPASGQPMIIPTKDIVLGLYYITLEMNNEPGEGLCFGSYGEMVKAFDQKKITYNSKIRYRLNYPDSSNPEDLEYRMIDTTFGRVTVFNLLPQDGKIKFEKLNLTIDTKIAADLITDIYTIYGQKVTVVFSDKIMVLGFRAGTVAGLSFGKDDVVVPTTKQKHVDNTFVAIKECEQQFSAGYITKMEKYNKVTDRWSECTDIIAKDMMLELAKNKDNRGINSIYAMMHSGARGSETQMRQMAGMRGLMIKPSGQIIETPIISNFKEGLTVIEYFNSAHGARKGLADTALKTADAGYLTRRLVDVSQDCVVTEIDCGTTRGIKVSARMENGKIIEHVSSIVSGRILAEDVVAEDGRVILKTGDMIDASNAHLLNDEDIQDVIIRSVITCDVTIGVCAKCYGKNLANGSMVNIGEAVGIIAAQSIGEPGTQLTMRTFHFGGVSSKETRKSSIEADHNGTVSLKEIKSVKDSHGNTIVISSGSDIIILDKSGKERSRHQVLYGSKLYIEDNAKVERGDKLCTWDAYSMPIISEYNGKLQFVDLINGVSCKENVDEMTGSSSRIITDWKNIIKTLQPKAQIVGDDGKVICNTYGNNVKYLLPVGSVIYLHDGDGVKVGDVIARIPIQSSHVKDITGGLPKVEEIFEARSPKEPAIVAGIDGFVELDSSGKTKTKVIIRPENDLEEPVESLIPHNKHIRVFDGSYVKKGTIIVDGNLDPHDILAINGVESLATFLVEKVQEVYRLQGARIDNKHIEIIIRYMLQKVIVTDPGASNLLAGQQVDRCDILEMNREFIAKGLPEVKFNHILQGITRASVQTKSFISAASFQETTKVLCEASVMNKKDPLRGLKESVIVGKLIPAGTGFVMRGMKDEARKRDEAAQEEDEALN